MKERPILFSAPMVQAILSGHKTQTRRVAPIADLNIKANSNDLVTWGVSFTKPVKGSLGSYSGGKFTADEAKRIIASQFCPYGQPGDRLWVREAFDFLPTSGPDEPQSCEIVYWATGGSEPRIAPSDYNPMLYGREKIRPSIHMPRWASRITLEITGVRVERLQDISEADAQAEGVQPAGNHDFDGWPKNHVIAFCKLWESINGSGSWERNDWVWVIEFRRVEPH